MKRLELTMPMALLNDVGILNARFFRHNASVEILQSFSVRPDLAALVVRVRRREAFKDAAMVRREARAIARRYRARRFEILSLDGQRGEYVAWIEWTLPGILRGGLSEEWGGVVPLEVSEARPGEVRVVLLTTESVLPRMRTFLDELGARYRVRSVRTAGPFRWEPLASLTARQRDVLELAFRLGYYASPAQSSLRTIASSLGISRAAVSKHLRAAERKLLAAALAAR